MNIRLWLTLTLTVASMVLSLTVAPTPACCPAPPSGRPVVNADQTVILIWDAATKTQHFIRKASFKSAADDFGFLVPTPHQPELEESGNDAFAFLQKLTEPEIETRSRPVGFNCGCGKADLNKEAPKQDVKVLEEKLVAGFHASVLETKSAKALVDWLKNNGYAFSREVQNWATPYIELGWKFTALKVAKDESARSEKGVTASALRISFKTDRPLFPYREPDPTVAADALGARHRLLRIYFLAEARYQGTLTKETPWTGKVVWSGKISAEDRQKTLALLNLPETSGPAVWHMTEFEDDWPYRVAPADVYFSLSEYRGNVRRPPIIQYSASMWPTDITIYLIAAALLFPLALRWLGRRAAKVS